MLDIAWQFPFALHPLHMCTRTRYLRFNCLIGITAAHQADALQRVLAALQSEPAGYLCSNFGQGSVAAHILQRSIAC